jgi:predicted NACHT family NTPase
MVGLLFLLLVGLLAERQRLQLLSSQHADAIAAEQGARAALLVQQPGQDGAALALAILSTAPALRNGRPVPTPAKEGLMLTYGTAKNSLPLYGHTDRIELVAFDPTGELLLTGSLDQTARLWNARTGRPLRVLTDHGGLLTTAVFSPDGRRVLTASTDGLGRLWEVETGELKVTLRGHTEPLEMGAFSASGDRIVTAGQDHTVRIWDAATGVELRCLRGHSERVPMAAFVPSGNLVVSGSFDQTVRLWDISTGTELRTFRGHRHRVNLVVVSSDGRRAAVADRSGIDAAAKWHRDDARHAAARAAVFSRRRTVGECGGRRGGQPVGRAIWRAAWYAPRSRWDRRRTELYQRRQISGDGRP